MAEYKSGQILVGFMSDFSKQNILQLVKSCGLSVLYIRRDGYIISVPEGAEDDWVEKFILKDPVSFAERM